MVNTNITNDIAGVLKPQHTLEIRECSLEASTFYRVDEPGEVELAKLLISKCTAIRDIRFVGWNVEWIEISELDIERNLSFEFCNVSHLRLNSITLRGTILEFKRVAFVESKSKAANFNSVIQTSKSFVIMESRLADVRWSFCDWSLIPMCIDDIVIDKVRLQGSSTPTRINPVNGHWKEVSDLFGLLEAYARSHGHTADAITNKANSLRAYRTYLGKQGRDRLDRITLWLSERISDYGSNWLKALGVLLSTGLILFVVVLLGSDNRISLGHIDFSTPSLALQYASYFLEFLSPFHKSTFLDIELNPISKLVDALSRIWMGFVIYHVVRSTRKFVS